jgi:hypothetical protein
MRGKYTYSGFKNWGLSDEPQKHKTIFSKQF